MANTLPASALVTTNELIGFIIYIFIPLLFVHPSKLQPFLMFWFFWWLQLSLACSHGPLAQTTCSQPHFLREANHNR